MSDPTLTRAEEEATLILHRINGHKVSVLPKPGTLIYIIPVGVYTMEMEWIPNKPQGAILKSSVFEK